MANSAGSRHFANPWPLEPDVIAHGLEVEPIEILSEEDAGRGTTGAKKLVLRSPTLSLTLRAKWKPMPRTLDGINNSPRKEIAAYFVQKLVLDPADYVVPPSVARCIPVDRFPNPEQHSPGPLPNTSGELGILSYWLDNVVVPDELFDPDRFNHDPPYAHRLANFNLVTFLVRHRDGRRGNFMVSKDDADRRVFAIDNGVSFSGIWYNWFVPNWEKIRVPALTQNGIDRLRAITRSDLEPLSVVVELHRNGDGLFVTSTPSAAVAPDKGVFSSPDMVQLGLSRREIDKIAERIEALLARVDAGEVRLLLPAEREIVR